MRVLADADSASFKKNMRFSGVCAIVMRLTPSPFPEGLTLWRSESSLWNSISATLCHASRLRRIASSTRLSVLIFEFGFIKEVETATLIVVFFHRKRCVSTFIGAEDISVASAVHGQQKSRREIIKVP